MLLSSRYALHVPIQADRCVSCHIIATRDSGELTLSAHRRRYSVGESEQALSRICAAFYLQRCLRLAGGEELVVDAWEWLRESARLFQ